MQRISSKRPLSNGAPLSFVQLRVRRCDGEKCGFEWERLVPGLGGSLVVPCNAKYDTRIPG